MGAQPSLYDDTSVFLFIIKDLQILSYNFHTTGVTQIEFSNTRILTKTYDTHQFLVIEVCKFHTHTVHIFFSVK